MFSMPSPLPIIKAHEDGCIGCVGTDAFVRPSARGLCVRSAGATKMWRGRRRPRLYPPRQAPIVRVRTRSKPDSKIRRLASALNNLSLP